MGIMESDIKYDHNTEPGRAWSRLVEPGRDQDAEQMGSESTVPTDDDPKTILSNSVNSSSEKILNKPSYSLESSVNDLSTLKNKSMTSKQFDLQNIKKDSSPEGPVMKPDRTPLSKERKMILIEKLTEALQKDVRENKPSVSDFKTTLLERLKLFHKPDPYNVLPSPETSEEEKEERLSGSQEVTDNLLSVIEEVEQKLESKVDEDFKSDSEELHTESGIDVVLSRIESEACPALRWSARPCTDCNLCLRIVEPIHKLAVLVEELSKSERCKEFTQLWRDIKGVIKTKRNHDFQPTKLEDCRPCELCCSICETYHEYVQGSSPGKRAQIRDDFAGVIKMLDPTTQIMMNASTCGVKQQNVKPKPEGEDAKEQSAKSDNIRTPSHKANTSDVTLNEASGHDVTSEFESHATSGSDNLDTSAGVTTIPVYETISSYGDEDKTPTTSRPISEKMRRQLVKQISKAISKEVRYLKKDITSRILGTLSPTLSNSDLRSIEKAMVTVSSDQQISSEKLHRDGRISPDLRVSGSQTTNFCLSPVLLSTKSSKMSKYDLLKQQPIAEEDKKERKTHLLANINRPLPKPLGDVNKQKPIPTKITPIHKETISSEESLATVPVPLSNSGLIHIKKKDAKKHKIRVCVKSRQRDNTLSNMTFPIDEEISEMVPVEDIPDCLLQSMDLSLQSNLKAEATVSSDSTVQRSGDVISTGEDTTPNEKSLSLCCVCGSWGYDYEADVSDSDPERKQDNHPTVSEAEGSEYLSDDSGGKTDFTAYTAVVPKKTITTQSSNISPPKKIKLDLPRSLTKNSSSSFLLKKGSSNVSLNSATSQSSLSKIPKKSPPRGIPKMTKTAVDIRNIKKKATDPTVLLSKPHQNTAKGKCKELEDFVNKTSGNQKGSGYKKGISKPKKSHSVGISQSSLSTTTTTTHYQKPKSGLPIKPHTSVTKPNTNRIPETAGRSISHNHQSLSTAKTESQTKPTAGNHANKLKVPTIPQSQTKTIMNSKTGSGLYRSVNTVKPKVKAPGVYNHSRDSGKNRTPSKPTQSSGSTKSISKTPTTSSAVKKSLPSKTEKRPSSIPSLNFTGTKPGNRKDKPISGKLGSSPVSITHRPTSTPSLKKDTLLPIPQRISRIAKLPNLTTKSNTSATSKTPERSVTLNNSKQSCSFDSGISVSRTKSFRITPVKNSDSMSRSYQGRSSPAVSISFPKSKKMISR